MLATVAAWLAVGVGVAAAVACVRLARWRWRTAAALPGPPLPWPAGVVTGHASLVAHTDVMHLVLLRLHERWGRNKLTALQVPGIPGGLLVLTSDAGTSRRLGCERDTFRASPMLLRGYAAAVGRGVLALEGGPWRRHRGALAAVGRGDAAALAVERFDAVACSAMRRHRGARELDIDLWAQAVIIDAATDFVAGLRTCCVEEVAAHGARAADVGCGSQFAEWHAVVAAANMATTTPAVMWRVALPPPTAAAAAAGRDRIIAAMAHRVAALRGGDRRRCWLGMAMASREAADAHLTDDEWAAEAAIMALGTIETVCHAISWCLFAILRCDAVGPAAAATVTQLYEAVGAGEGAGEGASAWRHAQRGGAGALWCALRAEVTAAAPRIAEDDVRLDLDALARCPTLEAVVKEALRLYAPIHGTTRTNVVDVTLQGYTIPAGSTIVAFTSALHTDAEAYPRPLAFLPSRWLHPADAPSSAPPPAAAFNTFGSGPKMCLGNRHAVNLIKAAVARCVATWFADARVAPTCPPITPVSTVVTRPAAGLLLAVTPLDRHAPPAVTAAPPPPPSS